MTDASEGLPIQAMTCDVEDYFQVSAFEEIVNRADWHTMDCRIPRNVDRILAHFADADVKGTFFVLGWVAKNHPDVVRRIAAEGHEVASHGMEHRRVWQQTPAEFLQDARAARDILQDTAGVPVSGYRAASWSIDSRAPWAHEMLAEAGYSYSSSIYPISHDHYGDPDSPEMPYKVGDTDVLEIPASVVRFCGRKVPASGGGFFRLFPLSLTECLIRRAQARGGAPYIFYFHPWEIDRDQPRMPGLSLQTRFRHYVNIAKVEARLRVLLERFRWGRMDEIFLAGSVK